MDDSTAPAAQDAAEALIAIGWPVVPAGDDMEQWQIGVATGTGCRASVASISHPHPAVSRRRTG